VKALIADDDKVNRRILVTFLEKWGYDVMIAADGNEAWQILQTEGAPRLVILDWMMPGMDGAEICGAIRKRNDPFYTYVILVTAKFQKQDILEGLAAGADDYITKPFDPHELRARLRTGQRILELQEDLRRVQKQLEHQACHDEMTGLWNRGAILRILESEVARARRQGHTVAIMMADLDHFKRINDRHGHLAGDEVLRQVALRLQSNLRAYDSIGRYGGEEFLIVVPHLTPDGLVVMAERLRHAVGDQPVEMGETSFPVSISIGVAPAKTAGNPTMDDIIRPADEALYRAKARGRNCVEAAPQIPAGLLPPPEVAAGTTVDSSTAAESSAPLAEPLPTIARTA